MRLGNPATLLILIQTFIFIAGSLAVTGFLKFNGYDPDNGIYESNRWPLIARIIRGWGMLGLLFPIASLVLVYRAQISNCPAPLKTLILITIFLGCVYGLSVYSSVYPPRLGPIQ